MQLPGKGPTLSSVSRNGGSKPTKKNDGFQLLQVKYSADSEVTRHLFVKQFSLSFHKGTSDDKPVDRTLFVINVPPFVTEHHVRFLFEKRCGKIERIFLQEKPSLNASTSAFNRVQMLSGGGVEAMEVDDNKTKPPTESVTQFFGTAKNQVVSYKVCYVVFSNPSGLANALKMASNDSVYCLKPSAGELQKEGLNASNFFTGIKLWQQQYDNSIVAPWQAKKVADSFLSEYKQRAEVEAAREKELAEQGPDEDGWVTVNRKLRRDKQALVSNQFFDQKIADKYTDRARKRKADEVKFEESVSKSMLETGKKKKRKGGRFNVDFMKES